MTRSVGRKNVVKLRDVLSVKDFTNTDGTPVLGNGTQDDVSGINAAITAANARTNGGLIVFPDGTYRTTSAIVMKDHVSLRGATTQNSPSSIAQGAEIDAQHAGKALSYTGSIGGDTNIGVYDLFIEGNGTATHGIYFLKFQGVRVERVNIARTTTAGIELDNDIGTSNSFTGDVTKCYVNMGNAGNAGNCYRTGANNVKFHQCVSDGAANSITIDQDAGFCSVIDCQVEGAHVAGVFINSSTGRNRVVGNNITMTNTTAALQRGVMLGSLSGVTAEIGNVVIGNTINFGGVSQATAYGVYLENNLVTENIVSDNYINGFTIGVNCNGGSNTMNGNVIVGNTTTASWGYILGSGSGNEIIGGSIRLPVAAAEPAAVLEQGGSTNNFVFGVKTLNQFTAALLLKTTTVASGAAVAETTATPVNVCSLSLTAGDWDVSGTVDRVLTGTTATIYGAGISLTSATMPSQAGGSGLGTDAGVSQSADFGATVTGGYSTAIPPVRLSLQATTTVYLVAADTFSAGTVGVYGTIRARRWS